MNSKSEASQPHINTSLLLRLLSILLTLSLIFAGVPASAFADEAVTSTEQSEAVSSSDEALTNSEEQKADNDVLEPDADREKQELPDKNVEQGNKEYVLATTEDSIEPSTVGMARVFDT